jgi:hypothetical protein
VVLEIKAKFELGEFEKAQIIHYLKATGLKKGLLLNFGCESLEYRRFVFCLVKNIHGRTPGPEVCRAFDIAIF